MSRRRSTTPTAIYDRVADASAALVIQEYSSSFGLASRLLREPIRSQVRTVYALVRVADEIVDDPDRSLSSTERAAMLQRLEEDVAVSLHTGSSANLVVHAFARTARTVGIGADLLDPFFASMRMDLSASTHTPESFARYVHGSAEVVGLMCLRAFVAAPDADGAPEATYEELRPGAQRLGAAFQKVNFLRDLAEDHDALGRTYFPGIDPDRFDDADRDRLVADIDDDLTEAAAALARLPVSSRRAVAVAHALFAELNDRLRRTPAREIRRTRVRVPTPVKLRLAARAATGGRG